MCVYVLVYLKSSYLDSNPQELDWIVSGINMALNVIFH